MDHLPAGNDPYRPIHIRYMPSDSDDALGYCDSSDRRRWISRMLENVYADDGPLRQDAADPLCSWIYFGISRTLMRISINTSHFTRRDGGGPWVTRQLLPAYVQGRQLIVAASAEEEVGSERGKECSAAVPRSVNDLAVRQIVNGTSRILTLGHVLSITVLVFTLDNYGQVCQRLDQSA